MFFVDVTSLHVWSESIITFLHIFIVSLSFLPLLVIHLIHFTSYSLLTATHLGFDTHFASFIPHITISSFCFICLLIDIIFTLGILRSMAHGIHYTCCISYMRAWFSDHRVFGPSFLSFLLPYHPSLRYISCLKTTLRPWDQMSSLTAFTWTGVWDLVDI